MSKNPQKVQQKHLVLSSHIFQILSIFFEIRSVKKNSSPFLLLKIIIFFLNEDFDDLEKQIVGFIGYSPPKLDKIEDFYAIFLNLQKQKNIIFLSGKTHKLFLWKNPTFLGTSPSSHHGINPGDTPRPHNLPWHTIPRPTNDRTNKQTNKTTNDRTNEPKSVAFFVPQSFF